MIANGNVARRDDDIFLDNDAVCHAWYTSLFSINGVFPYRTVVIGQNRLWVESHKCQLVTECFHSHVTSQCSTAYIELVDA
jgi:hypothetical protein